MTLPALYLDVSQKFRNGGDLKWSEIRPFLEKPEERRERNRKRYKIEREWIDGEIRRFNLRYRDYKILLGFPSKNRVLWKYLNYIKIRSEIERIIVKGFKDERIKRRNINKN